MIIYNITIKVEPSVSEEWFDWLRTSIARMMGSGFFLDYRICRLLQQDDQEGITYVLQFSLDHLETYSRYREEFAPVLEAEFAGCYAGKYVCFRTLMDVL